jgi:hypothetical protein
MAPLFSHLNFAPVITGFLTIDRPELAKCNPRLLPPKQYLPTQTRTDSAFEERLNWHVHCMDRDKGTWNESSRAGVWVNKACSRIVHWRKKKRNVFRKSDRAQQSAH